MDRLEAIADLHVIISHDLQVKGRTVMHDLVPAVKFAIQDMQAIADGRMVEVEQVGEGYNPKSIDTCGMIKRAMCGGAECPPKTYGDTQCDGYANGGGEPHEYCRACQFRSWKEDDEEEELFGEEE